MRLMLRLVGTWLVALAVVLFVIDGTRSLAANSLVVTSLSENWGWLHADSLAGLRAFVSDRFFAPLLQPATEAVLALPGWLALAVPGVLLAWAGRSRRLRVFVKHDQI